MTTKEYLRQANDLERKINILRAEIAKMRTLAMSPSIKMGSEKVQSSGSGDPMADTVIRIMNREEKLHTLIAQYIDKKEELEEVILSMDNQYFADVLYGRYVAGLNFHELGRQINRGRRQTINILNKATAYFESQYSDKYNE